MNIKDLMTKLSEIENRIDAPVYEVISSAEQTELNTLYLKLKDLGKDSRYTNYPNIQDLNREIDRYNSVSNEISKYATSTVTPGSDKPGMPEVPRQPMPGEKTTPSGDKTQPNSSMPLAGNQFAIMKMQKDLKAAGADLGNFGTNKDGIDGNLGGKNSKTRQAMKKYPEIAKKHGFGPSGQGAMADPNATKTDPNATKTDPALWKTDKSLAWQLKNAIEGVGTDSETVFKVLQSIKDAKQYQSVSKQYQEYTGETLMQGLKGDLSGGEMSQALVLLKQKGVDIKSIQ